MLDTMEEWQEEWSLEGEQFIQVLDIERNIKSLILLKDKTSF